MRVSSEEKERSRERILAAAGRMFRENGIAGSSVGDIMQAAGMTHGGFYRHFADKDALLAEALTVAFDAFAEPLAEAPEDQAAVAAAVFRTRYLSEAHLTHPGEGCPVAALGSEIARGGDGAKGALAAGVDRIATGLARGRAGEAARAEALRDLAMLVGAVVLARATGGPLAAEVLEACGGPAGPLRRGAATCPPPVV